MVGALPRDGRSSSNAAPRGSAPETPPFRREAAPVCEGGDVHSWLSGQPHDGNLAIGLLLVFAIAGSDLRDTGERLSPLLALQ